MTRLPVGAIASDQGCLQRLSPMAKPFAWAAKPQETIARDQGYRQQGWLPVAKGARGGSPVGRSTSTRKGGACRHSAYRH
ncbi:hypothetical protein BHE74_00053905 [Ensete ventricosum]|nr:hypothetical protein BHE74_00053905 [Ensete ventricosum]